LFRHSDFVIRHSPRRDCKDNLPLPHYHPGVNITDFDTDAIIIGAGPIGLELAVAFKREGIAYLQFDARQIGDTISWFPAQTRFFSSNDRIAIAGVPLQTPDQGKCTREQYLAYLRTVVQQFDLKVRSYESVTGIAPLGNGFKVTTRSAPGEREYTCRRLVLATGGTARPRRLGIPGEDLPHVSHRFDDPHVYFRKRLLIVGGKNSAIEAALRCHNAGACVSLSYRRAQLEPASVKYWLLPEMNGLLRSGEIKGYFGSQPIQITPSNVTLRDAAGATTDVPADFVLLAIGYESDMSLCRLAGVELRGSCEKPAFDDRTMETNVPGIHLAGTVTGGTQDKYEVFIENGHVHIGRIVAAITGHGTGQAAAVYEQPES
jgi:thioredoxin reductase (NADPH)